jgi:hypothetical protein
LLSHAAPYSLFFSYISFSALILFFHRRRPGRKRKPHRAAVSIEMDQKANKILLVTPFLMQCLAWVRCVRRPRDNKYIPEALFPFCERKRDANGFCRARVILLHNYYNNSRQQLLPRPLFPFISSSLSLCCPFLEQAPSNFSISLAPFLHRIFARARIKAL